MKTKPYLLLPFITSLLPQSQAHSDQVSASSIDYGTFAHPAALVRPRFRYWLPDASVDPAIVQKNIKDVGALGAGGVEFLGYYNYGTEIPGLDWSTYGFGSPAYRDMFIAALKAHKEADLKMDFALGANQGQGVPAKSDDEGLQWDLSGADARIPFNGSFDGILPGWGRGELVSVVTAEVLSSRNMSNPGSAGAIFDSQPSRTQYVIKNSTIREWSAQVSSTGRLRLDLPRTTGHGYRLFAFYQFQTQHKNLPLDMHQSGTIFDNGSWVVDHYSARGAETTTRFWDEHMLTDEVRSLLAAVGNYAWEDSIEIESNISWTPSLPDMFMKRYGYDLKPYLPVIMWQDNNINIQSGAPGTIQCLLDTPDQGKGYINDFRGALVDGYRAYLEHLTKWAEGLGLQMSAQVSYNNPMDALANIPFVNAPECERLQFLDNVDGYRQFVGPATLAGKRVISNEMGAVVLNAYQQTLTELLWQVNRAVVSGVNQMVIHGQTYSGNYYNTTWPGYTSFWYLFSGQWSEKQPSWDHGFEEMLKYVGRVQYTQQQGQPKIDVVMYNKDSATDPSFGTIYNQTDLIDEGFTYVYISPDNFALPQAHVQNGTFAPDGASFRAMVIPSTSNMTVQAVRSIKKYAQAGLPVILSGGLPNAYFTKDSVSQALRQEIASLKNTTNIYTVAPGQAAKKILSLGIRPRAHIHANGTWYSTFRTDAANSTDYLFILSDTRGPTSGTISVASTKRPYFFDAWTGETRPVLQYRQSQGQTIIPFTFAANDTVIIGLTDNLDGPALHAVSSLPSSVLGYEYSQSGALTLHVGASKPGEEKSDITLSSGKSINVTSSPSLSKSMTLSNWTLTVEHWARPANFSDAATIARKHNTTHRIPSAQLPPWGQIDASLTNVSGIGYYRTEFTLEQTHRDGSGGPSTGNQKAKAKARGEAGPGPGPGSKAKKGGGGGGRGVYLTLPSTPNGARLYINDHGPLPFNYQSTSSTPTSSTNYNPSSKIDISAYVQPGPNSVRVEVPATMWNYVRTMAGQVRTGGQGAQFYVFGSVPGVVENGVVGVASVEGFERVRIISDQ